jgi:hypothetical protein
MKRKMQVKMRLPSGVSRVKKRMRSKGWQRRRVGRMRMVMMGVMVARLSRNVERENCRKDI